MICLWEVLNLIIYQRLRSHFFPEYGRFAFWTENLIKSQFYGPLWHPKVKSRILRILDNWPEYHSFKPDCLALRCEKKHFRTVLKILKFWHLISTLCFHKSHENDEMLVKSLIFLLDFEQFWWKTQYWTFDFEMS